MGERPILPRPPHRRYFVVFTQGEPDWWDYLLTRKNRGLHVFLLVWDEFVWLCLNPTVGIVELTLIPAKGNTWQHPDEWLDDPQALVIETEIEYDERMRTPWCFGPLTCVEAIKAALGIRRFWLWTPCQLQAYLQRRRG